MKSKDSATIEHDSMGYRVVWTSTFTFEMDGTEEDASWYAPDAPTRAEAKQVALDHLYDVRANVANKVFDVPDGEILTDLLRVEIGVHHLPRIIATLVGPRETAIDKAVIEGINTIDEWISQTNKL